MKSLKIVVAVALLGGNYSAARATEPSSTITEKLIAAEQAKVAAATAQIKALEAAELAAQAAEAATAAAVPVATPAPTTVPTAPPASGTQPVAQTPTSSASGTGAGAETTTPAAPQTIFETIGSPSCEKWLADDSPANTKLIEEAAAKAKVAHDKLEMLRRASPVNATAVQKATDEVNRTQAELQALFEPADKFNLKNMPSMMAAMNAVVSTSPQNLGVFRDAMFTLKDRWNSLGEFGYADWSDKSALLDDRRAVADCAQIMFRAADSLANVTTAVTTLTQNQDLIRTHANQIREAYVEIAHRDVFDKAQLSVFVGPGFNLEADGDLKTGAEALILFDAGAGSVGNIGRSFVEFSYQSVGSVDTARTPGTPAPEVNVNDLFRSNKGYFRLNTGVSTTLGGRFSVATTFGLTSVLGTGDGLPESLRERYVISGLTRTFLSDGVYTRFAAGVGYDKYWRYDRVLNAGTAGQTIERQTSYGRFVVSGEILLPSATLLPNWVSGAFRYSLDTPLNGEGPSEVRFSALAYVNFNSFFRTLNPLYGK